MSINEFISKHLFAKSIGSSPVDGRRGMALDDCQSAGGLKTLKKKIEHPPGDVCHGKLGQLRAVVFRVG
ncbi:hypothetical protein [Pseudomonas syringae]|uniref:hypothetical protein n=1 Tax=Pseudomonas syringae TaxID=317 RepID=UPI001F07C864|nr:hypothetical protein [Pseudomonas syringae]